MTNNVILYPITVVNKHALPKGMLKPNQIYIGRGSPLGNQWSHLPSSKARFIVSTRDESIVQYKAWFAELVSDNQQAQSPAMEQLRDICRCAIRAPTQLVCWCHPLPCHGDVIKAFIQQSYIDRNK